MRCSCGQENPISATECSRCERPLLFGTSPLRLLVDIGAALGLLLALGLIFSIDGGDAAGDAADALQRPGKDPGEGIEVPAAAPRPLQIAVTPPRYDDMGKLLDALGSGYRYTQIELDDFLDADRLGQYDVVFATCGYVPDDWVGRRVGDATRDGGGFSSVRPGIARRLKENLRRYVGGGGTLYVSDWLFGLLEIVYPELIDRTKTGSGAAQKVTVQVVDPGLQRSLGQQTIELNFDKPQWLPAAFAEEQVTVLLSGTYQTQSGRQVTGPLLVQFPFEDGSVIFTSFHNEKQNSQIERQLLRYLVFTTVTAGTDAKVRSTMISGGFSPVERSLLAASPEDQSVTQSYDNPQECHLQFVLGFAARGAELRLEVTGPGSGRMTRAGTSTFTVDVPRAAKGQWQCTITPTKVPYENFPFTLTVGEKP